MKPNHWKEADEHSTTHDYYPDLSTGLPLAALTEVGRES